LGCDKRHLITCTANVGGFGGPGQSSGRRPTRGWPANGGYGRREGRATWSSNPYGRGKCKLVGLAALLGENRGSGRPGRLLKARPGPGRGRGGPARRWLGRGSKAAMRGGQPRPQCSRWRQVGEWIGFRASGKPGSKHLQTRRRLDLLRAGRCVTVLSRRGPAPRIRKPAHPAHRVCPALPVEHIPAGVRPRAPATDAAFDRGAARGSAFRKHLLRRIPLA